MHYQMLEYISTHVQVAFKPNEMEASNKSVYCEELQNQENFSSYGHILAELSIDIVIAYDSFARH